MIYILKSKIKLKLFVSLLIGLLLFLKNQPVHSQLFAFEEGRKKQSLNFQSIKSLIIVPLMVNNKGPYNFLLDTGVGHLVILDTSLLVNESLSQLKPIEVRGYGEGDKIMGFVSNNISVSIGRAKMNNAPIVILKEDVFNLSPYLGIPIHGILGNYFFDSFTVKVNYLSQKLTFIRPQNFKGSSWEKIKITMHEHKPYVQAQVKTPELGILQAKLLIDCGANHALSLEALNKNLIPIPSPNFEANLGAGLNGLINGRISRVEQVKLGSIEMNNVLTSFPNFNDIGSKITQIDRNGNLGANFLNKFHIIYDFRGSAIYLKKNNNFQLPMNHDMSGLEVIVVNKEFPRYVINRVEKDSPADKAGILPGDEILGINFKDVGDYNLDEITKMLQSESGRTIIFELDRNNKIFAKLISLKKRI